MCKTISSGAAAGALLLLAGCGSSGETDRSEHNAVTRKTRRHRGISRFIGKARRSHRAAEQGWNRRLAHGGRRTRHRAVAIAFSGCGAGAGSSAASTSTARFTSIKPSAVRSCSGLIGDRAASLDRLQLEPRDRGRDARRRARSRYTWAQRLDHTGRKYDPPARDRDRERTVGAFAGSRS